MNSFDEITLVYDNTIDWKSRLDREMPLLLSLLEDKRNPRVLDMACGTGRHSVALASHGIDVMGFDSSEAMIKAAKSYAEENNARVQFIVADMENIVNVVRDQFDLVICLGNSLALLKDMDTLRNVMREAHKILKEGGLFLAQVLNFEEIHWTGFRNFPLKSGRLSSGEEITFSRIFEHSDYPFSSTLVMSAFRRDGEKWISEVSTQKVLNLKHDQLKKLLEDVGFSSVEIFSDFKRKPLDKKYDRNMVIHCIK